MNVENIKVEADPNDIYKWKTYLTLSCDSIVKTYNNCFFKLEVQDIHMDNLCGCVIKSLTIDKIENYMDVSDVFAFIVGCMVNHLSTITSSTLSSLNDKLIDNFKNQDNLESVSKYLYFIPLDIKNEIKDTGLYIYWEFLRSFVYHFDEDEEDAYDLIRKFITELTEEPFSLELYEYLVHNVKSKSFLELNTAMRNIVNEYNKITKKRDIKYEREFINKIISKLG